MVSPWAETSGMAWSIRHVCEAVLHELANRSGKRDQMAVSRSIPEVWREVAA